MAVNKTPKLANEFWPAFINRQITKVIIFQIIPVTVMVGVLVLSDAIPIDSILLWTAVGITLITGLLLNLLNTTSTTAPLRDLMAAILNISGERTALTPPNPNDTKYENTGFKDALQTIYELSSEKGDNNRSAFEKTNESRLKSMMDALNITKCGFVVLNSGRKIIYANKPAPIRVDTSGQQILDLLFNGSDNLNVWLDECQENEVHAEHVWKRVPDKLPNEEGRRFFDVIASYQKGLAAETVLTLVDRTSTYINDEEDLDFISFAAHELRGPITVIKGYADILQDELADKLEGDQIELFRRLAVSSSRLSGYIDNILNTSRYDRKHLKMNLSEGNITDIYDMIADDMNLRASSQGRILNVTFPSDLPTIAVDKASMSEVLGNLIDNAIKYSNEGGTVNVFRQDKRKFCRCFNPRFWDRHAGKRCGESVSKILSFAQIA